MKKFRLPKEFTEKWLKALRSGEYKQAQNILCSSSGGYCCLGVAAKVVGHDDESLERRYYLISGMRDIPSELIHVFREERKRALSRVLACLNDGKSIEDLKGDGLIFRHGLKQLNFLEIADFIEDNCELY